MRKGHQEGVLERVAHELLGSVTAIDCRHRSRGPGCTVEGLTWSTNSLSSWECQLSHVDRLRSRHAQFAQEQIVRDTVPEYYRAERRTHATARSGAMHVARS